MPFVCSFCSLFLIGSSFSFVFIYFFSDSAIFSLFHSVLTGIGDFLWILAIDLFISQIDVDKIQFEVDEVNFNGKRC